MIVQTNEGERAIPRAGIVDIDHPGNVLAAAGLPFIALGIANLFGVWNCGEGQPSHAFCMSTGMGVVTISVGALMSLWGATIWDRSRWAAAVPAPEQAQNCGSGINIGKQVSRVGDRFRG